MGIDYYAILNISRESSLCEIQLAYRKWAILTHPNREPYPQQPENPPEGIVHNNFESKIPDFITWELVNEAYDILSNALRRQVYDLYGEEGLRSGVPAPNGYIQPYIYHGDYIKTYTNVFGTFSPYADLVDAVTNPPPLYSVNDKKGLKIKDKPVHKSIYLTLKEIYFGTIKKIKISRYEFIDELHSAVELREKIFTLSLPPGVRTGREFCFPEEGDQGPTKIPADIIFTIFDTPNEIYQRNNVDLYMSYKINLQQAICGFVLTILTIDDRKLNVAITDVVNPKFIKIIEMEGLPMESDIYKKGNLFVSFEIEFPVYVPRPYKFKLSQLFEQLDQELNENNK